MKKTLLLALAGLSVACQSTDEVQPVADPPTAEERAALQPASALDVLKAGNRRFVSGSEAARDWKALVEGTAYGAHPLGAVLTTTDPRVQVERALDASVGDLAVVRTLGAVPTDAAVRALEHAVLVDGAKELLVLVHGDCGPLLAAYTGDAEWLPSGGEALVLEAKRAVGPDVQPLSGVLADLTLEDNVTIEYGQGVVRDVLARSASLRAAVESGRLGTAVGFYDLRTGAIVWYK